MKILKVLFAFVIGAVGSSFTVNAEGNDETIIWATNGGAWRAMVMSMAYANLFAKAGLLSTSSSRFKSISVSSGSSWFGTQLFYSEPFLERCLAEDPQELHDFILEWMESYGDMYDIVENVLEQGILSFPVQTLMTRDASLVTFWRQVIISATKGYGDPDFVDRLASHDNRVEALSKTDLYIQATLYPTSRVKKGLGEKGDSITYIKPSNSSKVFTTPLPYQYAVKESGTSFLLGVEESSLPLRTCVTEAPRTFAFNFWQEFNYPLSTRDGKSIMSTKDMPDCSIEGKLTQPFGGITPTIFQVVGASSNILSFMSSLAPASFSQTLSVERNKIKNSNDNFIRKLKAELSLNSRARLLYNMADGVADFGMCTQWPKRCGVDDAQLGDGAFSDGISLAMHIGQHHSVDKGDKTKTLKAFVSVNLNLLDTYTKFLAFFDTTFNEGIDPGNFLWARTIGETGVPQPNPWRSQQIFKEYLDYDSLLKSSVPVPDISISTFRMTVTTIENPAFHVQAGQTVDLFVLLSTDEEIPGSVLFSGGVDKWKNPLAEMARDTASSEDLLDRVLEFVS